MSRPLGVHVPSHNGNPVAAVHPGTKSSPNRLPVAALYEAIVASADDAVFSKTLDGTVTSWNAAATRMYGYEPEEMIGQSVARLAPLDRPDEIPGILSRLSRGESIERLETVRVARDGRRVQVSLAISPIRDAEGTIVGASTIARDITDRKRAEAALADREALAHASEARFRALFEQSSIPTLLARSGIVIAANDAARQLFGRMHPDQIVDRPVVDLVAPRARPAVLARAAADERGFDTPDEFDLVAVREDGEEFPLRVRRTPIVLPDGLASLAYLTDLSTLRRAEAERERLVAAVEQSADTIVIADPANRILYVNRALAESVGRRPEELIGRHASVLTGNSPGTDDATVARAHAAGGPTSTVLTNVHQDGTRSEVQVVISPVHDAAGQLIGSVSIGRDVTRERILEEQLRHSQKMEAVGRLAGGIAHDFNNLLTMISGNTQLLLGDLAGDAPGRAEAEEIARAADRAAGLTRQLLAFSRKQVLSPQVLRLSDEVDALLPLVRRLVGESIEVVARTAASRGHVRADRSQLEQVVMNLVVNARDAMETGVLTMIVEDVVLDEAYAAGHLEVRPGPWVRLTVEDTGAGMDAATRARIFEPFFTTKPVGQGTGLGLSMVEGIVRQSGGYVWVYSEAGLGTTFKIYLPQVAECGATSTVRPPARDRRGGPETVLLVEDEPGVRAVAVRFLEAAGYRVVQAGSPPEAVAVLDARAVAVDLLLTDIVMPGGTGPQVARALAASQPAARVLYMSGYADETIGHHGVLEPGMPLLHKPFTREGLLEAVRTALDAPATRG